MTGSIISEVILVAERLEKEDGISVKIINVATLKPFDRESVIKMSNEVKQIFSVEEHSVIGGLGSSIADVIAEEQLPVKFNKIGLLDTFAVGYGTLAEVRAMNGLDAEGIYQKIKQSLVK